MGGKHKIYFLGARPNWNCNYPEIEFVENAELYVPYLFYSNEVFLIKSSSRSCLELKKFCVDVGLPVLSVWGLLVRLCFGKNKLYGNSGNEPSFSLRVRNYQKHVIGRRPDVGC
jgi:hypothetical protein